MGLLQSSDSNSHSKQATARRELSHELKALARQTPWSFEELQECHAAFAAQYPDGVIKVTDFVDENVAVLGGPPELWMHVFNLALASDEVTNAANQGVKGGAGHAPISAVTSVAPTDNAPLMSPTDLVGGKGTPAVGLTFANVMLLTRNSQYSATERKLKDAFNFFDVDRDGLITLDDLTVSFTWLFSLACVRRTKIYRNLPADHKVPSRRARHMLEVFDRDRDGVMTQDEFIESCRMDNTLLELVAAIKEQ